MSDYPEYKFLPDETVEEGVKRIARGLIDKAIADIDNADIGDHETVHEIRKRCKEIRGLFRIIRLSFKDFYKRENTWYRDAAAQLSIFRDSQSIIESYDKLMDHFGDIDRDEFSSIRERFVTRRDEIAGSKNELEKQLNIFRKKMQKGRSRVDNWSLEKNGFNALKGGLKKTYRRGRNTMPNADKAPSAENFHEWRKRVKYHWYHVRLLQLSSERLLSNMEHKVHLLADYLGDDHDLAILKSTLLSATGDFEDMNTIHDFIYLIDRRSLELRESAKPLGEKIYSDKPKWKANLFSIYWNAWKRNKRTETS